MSSLLILIPIALLLLGVAVAAFLWAVDHDQFEDLETEAERILLDDPAASADGPASPAASPRAGDGRPRAAAGRGGAPGVTPASPTRPPASLRAE